MTKTRRIENQTEIESKIKRKEKLPLERYF